MAYLSHQEEDLLKELVAKELCGTDDEARIALLEQTMDSLHANHALSAALVDVESVADDHELLEQGASPLTQKELDYLVHRVADYDYSDYNEFISDMIREVVLSRGDNT